MWGKRFALSWTATTGRSAAPTCVLGHGCVSLDAVYDQHRAARNTHHQALRALGNRLVGILHGCLHHHTDYDEHTAWAHRTTAAA
jgi:hypothetical protein